MGKSVVQWIGGKKFVGTDSTNHSVVLSTTDEGVGMKPSDLLLVAVATCSAVDAVSILTKRRTPPESLIIEADGEQDADPPWTFRKIHLKYILSGKGITPESARQAVELAEEKYCSVAATIRGVAEIIIDVEVLPQSE
jgi:putative redox protein